MIYFIKELTTIVYNTHNSQGLLVLYQNKDQIPKNKLKNVERNNLLDMIRKE
jgi:hypothetical protein